MNIIFSEAADEQRAYLTRRAVTRRTETHAYLLGTTTSDEMRIEHVLRVGDPEEHAAMTRPDYSAAGVALVPYLEAGLLLLGEWHRHDGLCGPSSGDVQTLRDIEKQFPGYICAITTTRKKGDTTTAHSLVDGVLTEHTVSVEQYPVLDASVTAERSMFIAGAGSGLAAQWPQLLSLGFAKYTICDADTIEERNLARHLADRASIGSYKVDYLKAFGEARTSSSVDVLRCDINAATRDDLTPVIATHDIIVNGTGHPLASLALSSIARPLGIPVIHAGVFARGRGGFVFVEQPDGPCYADAQQLDLRSDDNDTMRILREQYGYTEEQLSAQVGLWPDVNMVAALHLKVLVDHLKGTLTHNLHLINNHDLTITHATVAQRDTCICKGATR